MPCDGRDVTLLDTPGLGDPDVPHEALIVEIVRGVAEANACHGGAAAVALLLVISAAGRLDVNDLEALSSLGMAFGPHMLKRAIAIFTHGDLLDGGATRARAQQRYARARARVNDG